MRSLRIVAVGLLLAAAAFSQAALTAAQVTAFVKSAIQQKNDDRKVADYLSKVKLSDKLDARAVEDLQGQGAGPRTVAALKALSESSASLSTAPPPPPKPVVVAPAPPSAAEQKSALAEITNYALNYSQGLPNYICTQVTERNVDPTGSGDRWQLIDRVQEQLTYFDHKESYKVTMVSGKMVTNVTHDQLGGARSSGEFGTMLQEIFVPGTQTEFNWERWGTLDAHRMYVFTYRVKQGNSGYSITHDPSGRKIISGYHGEIFADRDSRAIMRVTLICDTIPADYPIQDVKLDMRYELTSIAEQKFVLPANYELTSRDGVNLVRNLAEFRLYRKFGAEATITFDAPDAEPAKNEKPK